jgi:LacI family transcriptional regulator, galactose operon repressor
MNLTLVDVAKIAGVSRSTVSRVVNNHPNVRPEVRQRVRKVIEETGYHPNEVARSLRSHRSSLIGLVIPRSIGQLFTDPYLPLLTQGVAQAVNQHYKTLALFIEDQGRSLISQMTRHGFLDGVVVQIGKDDTEILPMLIDGSLPFVMVGRPAGFDNVNYVNVDNLTGSYKAVMHLIRLGYQKIATITGPLATTTAMDRLEGYYRALRESNLPYDEKLVVEGDYTEKGGYLAGCELLKHKPEAIFASSDTMARGIIRAYQEAGFLVPQDIGVVGYDDVPLAISQAPMLTTVRQPISEAGAKAVEMLLDVIENGAYPPRHLVMDVELVVRDSCGHGMIPPQKRNCF